MQNKANFRKAKMNINLYLTMAYKNETAFRVRKNKPKQSQFQNRQNEPKCCFNKGLCKKTRFPARKNKAKTNPIGWMPKMNVTSFITSDYDNKRPYRRWENKPNSNPIFKLFAGDVVRRKLCSVTV